jgi:hypothetical protein
MSMRKLKQVIWLRAVDFDGSVLPYRSAPAAC